MKKLLIACSLLCISTPALLNLEPELYKNFTVVSVIAASMAVILPEIRTYHR